jgi:hypothetical protein
MHARPNLSLRRTWTSCTRASFAHFVRTVAAEPWGSAKIGGGNRSCPPRVGSLCLLTAWRSLKLRGKMLRRELDFLGVSDLKQSPPEGECLNFLESELIQFLPLLKAKEVKVFPLK